MELKKIFRDTKKQAAKNYCSFYSLHDWRECFKRAIVMIKVAVHTIHSTSFSISWKTSVRSLSTSKLFHDKGPGQKELGH